MKCTRLTDRPPVLVLSIGNILLRDEGLGAAVIEALSGMELPDGVELLDGGTGGADLLDIICDRKKLVVIDAIGAGLPSGSIVRLTADDLQANPGQIRSLHDFGLIETLAMAKHLGCAPEEVVVVGVEPKDLSVGIGVSEAISSVMPRIKQTVLNELLLGECT